MPTARSASATRPSSKAPSADTLARRQRFQQAVFYGRAAHQDPASKVACETGLNANTTSAYTVAVADFLNAPDIMAVDFAA